MKLSQWNGKLRRMNWQGQTVKPRCPQLRVSRTASVLREAFAAHFIMRSSAATPRRRSTRGAIAVRAAE